MRISRPVRTAGRLSPLALALLVVALLLSSTGGAVAGALITGAQIKNGTVTGADIKNRSLTGSDIRDKTLTKSDIADPPLAWGKQVTTPTDNFTTATYTPLVTKALTAPRAGFLTVTVSLYAEDDSSLVGIGRLQYALRLDGVVRSGTAILNYSDASTGLGESGSVTLVVPAAKGAHTVELVVRELGAGSFLYGGRVAAVYTPAGSAEGIPTSKVPAPRQGQR